MKTLTEIEERLDAIVTGRGGATDPGELLALGETVLEHWVIARGGTPTADRREGFRLLALHRQGAQGDASFNACRETCRELVYHYNLLTLHPDDPESAGRLKMMALVANHLCLFISGKLQTAQLGEFCCSSKPLHAVSTREKDHA